MDQAWLDSLSEDWVSQPRSSGSPAPSLPSLTSSTSNSSNPRLTSSRIPKYRPRQSSWAIAHDSSNALAERSPSDNNIPPSQRSIRRPSKLREQISKSARSRRHSRSASASSASQPTQYHTIQHNKSVSVSPKKGPQETPEWKRRLLHGDVAYGEQRELFSPAGLESIFQPPQSQTPSPSKQPKNNFQEESMFMPSSPPPYNREHEQEEVSEMEKEGREQISGEERSHQQPRMVKYKLVDIGESEFSTNDLRRSSSFRPVMATSGRDDQMVDVLSDPSSNFESSVLPTGEEHLMAGAVRMVSGQSDVRNEELSPIYISRHTTIDGAIDYAALSVPPGELQERLEKLQIHSDLEITNGPEDTSQGLSENVTRETDDYARIGHFVNLRRGGYSQEGSFRQRMLSPSSLPAIDESAMLPEESMQASTPKQLPNIKKTRASNEYTALKETPASPLFPRAPHPSPAKSDGKVKSTSGSPLKLFGTYDTFTNQKLLRRLSQFEEHFDDDTEQEIPSGQETTQPELNEGFVLATSPEKVSLHSHAHNGISRKVNSFGEGELDGFEFSEAVSYDSSGSSLQDEDKENVSLPVLDPNTQTRFKFILEPSPALEEGAVTERQTKYTHTMSTTKQTVSVRTMIRPDTGNSDASSALPSFQRIEDLETPRKRNGDSEGKRLPKSPLKDPTPKRRRTLQKTETTDDKAVEEALELDSLMETHKQIQAVISRKRKDARHSDDQQAANPKVLAMRQILRPRTPTPSQRSSQQQEHAPIHDLDFASTQRERLQREKIAKIQAELDSTDPLKVSTEFGRSHQMYDDSRKGSVTTQDFLDEAKKIMAGIRGKARPRSGLTSVEESESENDRNKPTETTIQDEEFDDSYQESTKEPFSRPPSREGAPVPRLPVTQQDPDLLKHLRKYQEMSDMDGIIASSIKSIAMAKDAADSAREIDRIAEETISRASGRLINQGTLVESEPPNIRINENPEVLRKRKHSSSSGPTDSEHHHEAEFPSQGSNASSRSIPTGSSRGSDSRRVIAPHTVSHLIPEQLAGMVFDRERNIWVKRKTVSGGSGPLNFLPSDETEDDPFGDIPDLSVDETQELQRIKAVAAKRKADEQITQLHPGDNHLENLTGYQQPTPSTSNSSIGNLNLEQEPSSEQPSNPTGVPSNSTVPENHTRITSWGDDQSPTGKHAQPVEVSQGVHQSRLSTETEMREEIIEEVEREISIHEDRVAPSSAQRRRRNVTISFSSPVASVIQASQYDHENSFEAEAAEGSQSDENEDEGLGDGSVIINKTGRNQNRKSTKVRTTYRSTSRHLSLSGHMFSARPVSRIDEQDEESFSRAADKQNRRSLSIGVATPVSSRRVSSIVFATPRPAHEIGSLELTPLSDFTIHQADESFGLEVSYIEKGQRYVPGSNTKRALSLSIKELVEKLTEVEPFEPFWEHIKHMDLKDKRLTNLHKLDEFCEELEELDVSKNQICHLNGAPTNLRHLRITHNYLSDLTAWGHLINLQYIDVSNNELESLSAFKYLIHLRGLRADNNKIQSLDGIGNLDGLLSLRLRGNMVESLDFSGTKLQRLTDLDIRQNQICDIRNLHELQSLSNLDLEDNNLSGFLTEGSEPLRVLKYLKLSGNNLESIDVSQCPNLRLLYLDRNRIGTVTGLLKTKRLDSLSLREQQDGTAIDPSFLDEAFEVRKLFLSGNLLHTFKPRVDFLNLQYLELANCGLETLPIEFGQMLSNTRVLNLNFNALRDIKALLGILRLKKLHLAGNRLSRLRKTTNVLSQLPTLTLIDLRSNPLTQGFYSPVIESRLVARNGIEMGDDSIPEPFTLGRAEREKDEKYAGRLDMDTRMLRRVYEMLTITGCSRLKILDGLSVDRSVLGANDRVWEALVKAGVVEGTPVKVPIEDNQEAEAGNEEELPQPEAVIEKSDIWHAEDSFA